MLGLSAGKKGSSMLYTVQLLIKIRRQRPSFGSERGCVQDDGDETGVFEISVPVLGSMTGAEPQLDKEFVRLCIGLVLKDK